MKLGELTSHCSVNQQVIMTNYFVACETAVISQN